MMLKPITVMTAFLCVISIGDTTGDQNLPPIRGTDFKAVLIAKIMGGFATTHDYDQVPRKVKYAYAECSSEYIVSGLSPANRQALDAYAQGKTEMTDRQYAEIGKTVDDRVAEMDGFNERAWQQLDVICPESTPAFRQYFPKR